MNNCRSTSAFFRGSFILLALLTSLSCLLSDVRADELSLADQIKAAMSADDQNVDTEFLQSIHNMQSPADRMIRQQEFPERRLSKSGVAGKLLIAAGVTDVAANELVGIVLNTKGEPIAGASVDAFSWFPGHETTTDNKGLFRLKGFDKDYIGKHHVQLVIAKDGYSPRIVMRLIGRKDLVVIMNDQTCIEGIVLGPDAMPAKGAKVTASCGPINPDPGYQISEVPFETTTDDEGRYRLPVCSSIFDLKVVAAGRGVFRRSDLSVAQNETVLQPVLLERGVRFRAHVIDSQTEKPFEGFVMFTFQAPLLMAKSDATGTLVLDDLFPGQVHFQCGAGEPKKMGNREYYQHGPLGRWWSADAVHEYERLQIDDPNRKWQRNFDGLTFDMKPEMDAVTIIVEQGVMITGTVTDPDGNPVKGATVAPALTGTGNSLTGDTRYSVSTDKDGRYRSIMPASHDAQYNLVVHDGKYNQWRNWANGISEVFQTTPGQVIENKDLKLTKPAVIRGRVTSFGKPVAGRKVRTHDASKHENRYYDPTVTSDAEGKFELKFVRPGEHYLQAEPFWMDAEQDNKASFHVEAKAGEVLEDLELQVDGK